MITRQTASWTAAQSTARGRAATARRSDEDRGPRHGQGQHRQGELLAPPGVGHEAAGHGEVAAPPREAVASCAAT